MNGRLVKAQIVVARNVAFWLIAAVRCSTISPKMYASFGIREIRYGNYRVAVGPLVGQGCDRSELPCLADGITKLGRRSWSF